MLTIKLDHLALGLHAPEHAEPLLEGVLGGAKAGGADGEPFGFAQWVFEGGARIEVIYPGSKRLGARSEPEASAVSEVGFLQRFLARGGPRVHHVTFKVSSLDAMLERAAALEYDIASLDRTDPFWQEAFLHPKQAQGIVVQLVQHSARPGGFDPATARPVAGAARVLGPRLAAPSADAARRQWGELLGGRETRDGPALVFTWSESPLAILIDIEADAEPGPRQIEVSAPRPLALPSGVVPRLGTRFVQV